MQQQNTGALELHLVPVCDDGPHRVAARPGTHHIPPYGLSTGTSLPLSVCLLGAVFSSGLHGLSRPRLRAPSTSSPASSPSGSHSCSSRRHFFTCSGLSALPVSAMLSTHLALKRALAARSVRIRSLWVCLFACLSVHMGIVAMFVCGSSCHLATRTVGPDYSTVHIQACFYQILSV